jgi:type I restriction enzyme, S subunit
MATVRAQLAPGQPASAPGQPAADPGGALIESTWGVIQASVIRQGERRLEAEMYLSDGYGLRAAIEARSAGWQPLGELAHVWQPSRLKGIVVPSGSGTPFLAAGQVFEARPRPRKWLSLAKTPKAAERFVKAGTILVTCSGNVGRVTIAYRPHLNTLITHDLMRIEPQDPALSGWLYAFFRTSPFRLIATGEHYGHVIKHLEVGHLNALPVVTVNDPDATRFRQSVQTIFSKRDEAYGLIEEAEALYSAALGLDSSAINIDLPFTVSAGSLSGGRRRLDAFYHNQLVEQICEAQKDRAKAVRSLAELTSRIWWPDRFKRVFGDNGTPYVSAEDLFDLNPIISKRVYAGLVDDREDYFLEPEWLVVVRSGQVYGLNGSVRLVGNRLTKFFVSEDLIRISPDADVIRPGYLLCALSHPVLGRPLVIRNAYGTSIPHLEPSDVGTIPVPRFDTKVEAEISDRIELAVQLQAEADVIEDEITAEAEEIVRQFIHGISVAT